MDWSLNSYKQEDLIEEAIKVIDTKTSKPSPSSKLAAAVEVIGQSSTDNIRGQKVQVDVHSRPSGNPVKTNEPSEGAIVDKRPRLFRKNREPIYSSIEEVTSHPAQRISTGFDEPMTKQPPFPEASTEFRGSPSYETVRN
jgi:hypothetical protein